MNNKILRVLAISFVVVFLVVATVRSVNENPLAKATETIQTQVITNIEASTINGSWTEETPMVNAINGLGAVAVDGKIYAIGGRNDNTIFSTTQQYNPATNQWTNKAPMPTPRFSFAITASNGKIYCIGGIATLNFYQVGGGFTLSNVTEVYDPATDTWTTGASMPQASDGKATIVNGEIYVMSARSNPNLNLNQAYNPSTNQWSTKTPMPDRNGWCAASAVIGNKIYVIGGYTSSPHRNIVQIYDTISDSWTAGTPPPISMGGYVTGAVTIGTQDSPRVELFGLTEYATTISNGSTANQIYDPSTDNWTIVDSMPTSRERFGIALINNEIYTIGGSIPYYPFPGDIGGSTWYFSTNERYTIPTAITMPTPTTTQVPATNTTQPPPPTQSEPNPNISTNELVLGAVVVATLIVTVSVIFVIARRSKSGKR